MLKNKIKQIRRYIKIYPYFVSCSLQSIMSYHRDFILGIVASVLMQVFGYTFIWSIFQNINELNNWSFYQISFVYGMSAITLGISQFFLNGPWNVGMRIQDGSFDRVLLRPFSITFYMISSDISVHGIGSFVFGLVVCIRSLLTLNIGIHFEMVLYWIIFIICGSLIHFSVNMITSSFSIWVINSQSIMMLIYNFSEFNKYPIVFYPKVIQFLLSFILPYAFSSYYPSVYLLGIDVNILYLIGPVIVTIFFVSLSSKIWTIALKSYQSGGG